jgi:hypothetical protein
VSQKLPKISRSRQSQKKSREFKFLYTKIGSEYPLRSARTDRAGRGSWVYSPLKVSSVEYQRTLQLQRNNAKNSKFQKFQFLNFNAEIALGYPTSGAKGVSSHESYLRSRYTVNSLRRRICMIFRWKMQLRCDNKDKHK